MCCLLVGRCREAGIEEFIVKPFRVEDLRRVINVCNRVVTSRGSGSGPTVGAAATAETDSAARQGVLTA